MGPPRLPSGDPAVGRFRVLPRPKAHKKGRIPAVEPGRMAKKKIGLVGFLVGWSELAPIA